MDSALAVRSKAQAAREATFALQSATAEARAGALQAVCDALERDAAKIIAANERDLTRARREGLAAPLLKRLHFDGQKIAAARRGINALLKLDDPMGRVLERRELDDRLILSRVGTPLGVVGMIFESRPDALVQIATLAIKSGNALILKGGSEARESNRVLAETIAAATRASGYPHGWLQHLESREEVDALLAQDEFVDLLIPRGSNEFVRHIMERSRIPVLGHADGICHIYVDATAPGAMAIPIIVDAKTQYVAVCNAVETLLVHRAAAELLPAIGAALGAAGVEIRACSRTRGYLPAAVAATEADWRSEYLDTIIAVRMVDSLDEAVRHINHYGSHHTDAIVTADEAEAERFLRWVDSSSVLWNASTRFADGYRYGLGAELGISTARVHARGPVGIEGMMSYKWLLRGNGQIVADYVEGRRNFAHRQLDP